MISILYFLEGAVKIPTVSVSPDDLNATAMAEFGRYIQEGTKLSFLAMKFFVLVMKSKRICVVLEHRGVDFYFVFLLRKGLAKWHV